MQKVNSMAITYKVFLDTRHQKNDGSYPLKVRVTINRRSKEFSLNTILEKKYWDEKQNKLKPAHPNYKLIQLKISKKLIEIQEKILTLENHERVVTIEDIVNSGRNQQTFLEFARDHSDMMLQNGRVGNYKAYKCAINKLEKFLGNKDILFINMEDFFRQKIVWGNLNLCASYALASEGMFVNAPCPMIVPANKFLLAVLNSKLADYYIRSLGVTRNGGYFEYKPMFIEKLPVPTVDLKRQEVFHHLVERVIDATKNKIDTSLIEDQIDAHVYELYDMAPDEIPMWRQFL